MHQRHNVTLFSLKSRKVQYRKDKRDRENKKSKRDGENEKSEKDRKNHWRNKVDPVVNENSSLNVSDHYYIIYGC